MTVKYFLIGKGKLRSRTYSHYPSQAGNISYSSQGHGNRPQEIQQASTLWQSRLVLRMAPHVRDAELLGPRQPADTQDRRSVVVKSRKFSEEDLSSRPGFAAYWL